jgi:hypothetical protein
MTCLYARRKNLDLRLLIWSKYLRRREQIQNAAKIIFGKLLALFPQYTICHVPIIQVIDFTMIRAIIDFTLPKVFPQDGFF